ncbi:MAG TPA: S8 family serine peptidase [Steroidobacteraceae bacterium]|nr:S8 family serine peptidase [Steroidobacteraceae bacterium]
MLIFIERPLRALSRAWRAVAPRALVIALGALITATAVDPAQAADARTRFKSVGSTTAQKGRPLSMSGNEPVRLVVRLQSDSVAEVRARSVTHTLSDQDESAVVATAHREHVAITPSIHSLGGKVVAEYHHALNGVAVMIPRRQAAALAQLPGVRSVHPVATYRITNAVSIPFLDVPAVWQGHPSLKGEGVKIAIIDTGIDYTHANFGGPGTIDAWNAAVANSTQPADPTLFGRHAPKVKGGIDLAGDNYNADDPTSVPVPDPNPLDCAAHGSHVAGTAAGFGVANGVTYHGPYNAAAYTNTSFDIGPGVAPKADLYAVRVFGCAGSTNLVTDAIDWAVQNHMDVISMSLGSPFGTADTSDSVAEANAIAAGISVVAAAGNEGPGFYIAGTPASADHVLSAAAMDARASLANGVIFTLSDGVVFGVEANDLSVPPSAPLVVLKSGAGLALGCSSADYQGVNAAGAVVVVSRGSCTFSSKAVLAEAAGAAAIGVVNNAAGYQAPSFSTVPTIPFIEMLLSDTATLLTAGPSVALATGNVPNPTFETLASFSSGGPRFGDSAFKPNVTAPGVGVISTSMGTGNQGVAFSGTSMATPHVAGVAALTREAHPHWSPQAIEAAIVQTATPSLLTAPDPRMSGSGVVQPVGSTETQVVAQDDQGNASLSFGFEESTRDYSATRELTIRNLGRDRVRYSVSYSPAATATGVPHSISLSRTSIAVDGHDSEDLKVSVHVPVATVGATHDNSGNQVYEDVAGYIELSPTGGSSAPALMVPYYLTTRARSHLDASLQGNLSPHHASAGLKLSNKGGAITGSADFYAWGLSSPSQGDPYFDTRAVGVQSNILPGGADSFMVFAVNTYTRFSNAAIAEWDVLIDVNGDGQPDYVLFSGDHGYWINGAFDGTVIDLLYDVNAGTLTPLFFADVPTDGSTILMPVYASQLGITPANPLFSYQVQYFDNTNGGGWAVPGSATFNAFSPSISNALYFTVPPGVAGTVPVAIDPTQWATSPALGLMIVSEDNASGPSQAVLLKAGGH